MDAKPAQCLVWFETLVGEAWEGVSEELLAAEEWVPSRIRGSEIINTVQDWAGSTNQKFSGRMEQWQIMLQSLGLGPQGKKFAVWIWVKSNKRNTLLKQEEYIALVAMYPSWLFCLCMLLEIKLFSSIRHASDGQVFCFSGTYKNNLSEFIWRGLRLSFPCASPLDAWKSCVWEANCKGCYLPAIILPVIKHFF